MEIGKEELVNCSAATTIISTVNKDASEIFGCSCMLTLCNSFVAFSPTLLISDMKKLQLLKSTVSPWVTKDIVILFASGPKYSIFLQSETLSQRDITFSGRDFLELV